MMTDPLADMLTRIRNAVRIERPAVDMRATKLKKSVAKVLKDEGFIQDFQVGLFGTDEQGQPSFEETADLNNPKATLRVYLKYGPDGERVIRHVQRYSKPGLRVYKGYSEFRPVLDGLGIAVISTSRGVMSDRRARVEKVGGEVLCTVW